MAPEKPLSSVTRASDSGACEGQLVIVPESVPCGCGPHWSDGKRKAAMRMCQLNEPLAARYWLVYQKVQPSRGSTVIAV